jgi:hypothetical protein
MSATPSTGYISAISFWCGICLGILALIDFLLSNAQRLKVQGWVEAAWVDLDDLRDEKLYKPYKSYKVQFAIPLGSYLSCCTIVSALVFEKAITSKERLVWLFIGNASCSLLFSWLVLPKIIRWVVAYTDVGKIVRRSIIVCYVSCVPFGIMGMIYGGNPMRLLLPTLWPYDNYGTLFACCLLYPFGVSFSLLYFFDRSAYAVVSFLMTCCTVISFILLRIAENSKGPLIGLSGLFVAIGLLTKDLGK